MGSIRNTNKKRIIKQNKIRKKLGMKLIDEENGPKTYKDYRKESKKRKLEKLNKGRT